MAKHPRVSSLQSLKKDLYLYTIKNHSVILGSPWGGSLCSKMQVPAVEFHHKIEVVIKQAPWESLWSLTEGLVGRQIKFFEPSNCFSLAANQFPAKKSSQCNVRYGA